MEVSYKLWDQLPSDWTMEEKSYWFATNSIKPKNEEGDEITIHKAPFEGCESILENGQNEKSFYFII